MNIPSGLRLWELRIINGTRAEMEQSNQIARLLEDMQKTIDAVQKLCDDRVAYLEGQLNQARNSLRPADTQQAIFNLLCFLVEYLTGNSPAVKCDLGESHFIWYGPQIGSVKFHFEDLGRFAVLCPSVNKEPNTLVEPLASLLARLRSSRQAAVEDEA